MIPCPPADSPAAHANSQATNGSPPGPTNPQSEIQHPKSEPSPGRPRTLDNAKRSEIIELLSGGFDLDHAARQARCSVRTIRREMKRNPRFASDVRRSEIFAIQNPLGALQHALHRNWRAAAWLLERLYPERFARRPETTAFGKRQARQLLNEVLQIVDASVIDTSQRDCINGRIRATFEYFTHVYCERKRSKADLRRAIEFFEKKDDHRDPLAGLGWLAPNYKATSNPMCDPAVGKEPSPEDAAAPKRRAPRCAHPKTISDVFQDLIDA